MLIAHVLKSSLLVARRVHHVGGLDGAFLVLKLEQMVAQARSSLPPPQTGVVTTLSSTQATDCELSQALSAAADAPAADDGEENAAASMNGDLSVVAAATRAKSASGGSKTKHSPRGGVIKSGSASTASETPKTGAQHPDNVSGGVSSGSERDEEVGVTAKDGIGEAAPPAGAASAEALRAEQTAQKLKWADEVSAAASAAVAAAAALSKSRKDQTKDRTKGQFKDQSEAEAGAKAKSKSARVSESRRLSGKGCRRQKVTLSHAVAAVDGEDEEEQEKEEEEMEEGEMGEEKLKEEAEQEEEDEEEGILFGTGRVGDVPSKSAAGGSTGGAAGGVIDLGGVGDEDSGDEKENADNVSDMPAPEGKAAMAEGSDGSEQGIVIAQEEPVPTSGIVIAQDDTLPRLVFFILVSISSAADLL